MTRNEKRHPPKPEYEWSTSLGERLREVIADTEKELAYSKINEWARAKEVANPTHMGKQQAEEELGLYQKHVRFLEEKVEMIRLFLTEKGL